MKGVGKGGPGGGLRNTDLSINLANELISPRRGDLS